MNPASFFRQRVRLRRRTGANTYGESTFAAPTWINARVVGMNERTLGPRGDDITTDTRVSTVSTLTVGDEIEVGSEWRAIQNVSEARDTRARLSHYVARL